jgi:hypothetical protein
MRTFRTTVSIVALLLALCVPATALAATHKAPTRFLNVPDEVRIPKVHDPGEGGVISGRLQYHGIVHGKGKRRTAWLPQNGVIRVYKYDMSTGRLHGARVTTASNGRFRVEVGDPGYYRVQFGGTHARGMCAWMVYVESDSMGFDSLTATSASQDATGNVFLTLSAAISAQPGALTTQTPAMLSLVAASPTAWYGYRSALPIWMPYPYHYFYFYYPYTVFSQPITAPADYRLGFTVPAASRDETLAVEAEISAPFAVSKVATLTVKPSSLLP